MKNGRIKLLALAGVIGVTVSGAIFAFSAKAEKLDATTEEIFAHADKVEALRLSYYAAGNPDPTIKGSVYDATSGYVLQSPLRVLNKKFAPRLLAALHTIPVQHEQTLVGCFDPGVGFRVWHGKAWTEVFVCFHCGGLEMNAVSADGKKSDGIYPDLGNARKPLLALSREAFPNDRELKDVVDELKP